MLAHLQLVCLCLCVCVCVCVCVCLCVCVCVCENVINFLYILVNRAFKQGPHTLRPSRQCKGNLKIQIKSSLDHNSL